MNQVNTLQSLAHISLSPPLSLFVLICFSCFPHTHTSFHKHELQDKDKRFFFYCVVLENWVGRERLGFFFINASIKHLTYPAEDISGKLREVERTRRLERKWVITLQDYLTYLMCIFLCFLELSGFLPITSPSVCITSWMDTTGSRVWVGWKAEIANLGRRKKGKGVVEAMVGPTFAPSGRDVVHVLIALSCL